MRSCATTPIPQAALSPNTGNEAVPGQGDVDWPFGMLREYPLLGVDAVDQRCPTDQYEKECNEIPFLQVVPDVCKYIGEIHRVADEFVGSTRHQTSQSGTNPEESSHSEKANKTKTSPERYQDQPGSGPRLMP